MKILIIEDERKLSDSIRSYLESQKYLCEQAFDFADAKLKVGVYDYDCVLLDLMLPGGDGIDLLREIRARRNPVGVIIISAKDSLEDKLTGLQIGADDYLPKPFPLPELSMRIYALIRRKEFSTTNVLQAGEVTIDLLERTVSIDGTVLELTKTEYELLLFFISNRGKVITKSAIAEHLSGEMADMLDNFDFIYSHIKNLKAKLSDSGAADHIKTIYGMGYKWIES
ncbi:MAG: response regulator transcription factor [Prevotella sp.]|nr:response regulator transcription factor [Prevotella sp.]